MKLRLPTIHAALLLTFGGAAQAADFSLSSPTFQAHTPLPRAHVYNGFGCTGDNRSPALQWQHAPAGTKSYAVTLYDPDAPTGSGWWHWVMYNIPAQVQALPEDAGSVTGRGLPSGAAHGRTDFGTFGFGGACPPAGMGSHRYVVTLHALKVSQLPAPADASPAMIGFLIHMNQLGSAVLRSSYGR